MKVGSLITLKKPVKLKNVNSSFVIIKLPVINKVYTIRAFGYCQVFKCEMVFIEEMVFGWNIGANIEMGSDINNWNEIVIPSDNIDAIN